MVFTNAKFHAKDGDEKTGNDKIIQHNSDGIAYINNFYLENSGKFYGNCKKGYQGKKIVYKNVIIVNKVSTLAGYNPKYGGDIAILKNVEVNSGHACRAFQGRNDNKEPTSFWMLIEGT